MILKIDEKEEIKIKIDQNEIYIKKKKLAIHDNLLRFISLCAYL